MTLVRMKLKLLTDTGNGTGGWTKHWKTSTLCVCVCVFSLKPSMLKKLEHFFSIYKKTTLPFPALPFFSASLPPRLRHQDAVHPTPLHGLALINIVLLSLQTPLV